MNKIKVLVADDHAIVRMGLVSLLKSEPDLAVVAEADDGEDAVRKTLRLSPDVVVIDLMMPGLDGIEATRRILSKAPATRILILTTSTVSDDLAHALEAGALGAINKSSEYAKLLAALHAVAEGKQAVAPEIRRLIAEDPPVPALSPRQEEIMRSLTRGLSNPDIALELGISKESVKLYIDHLCTKLGAANRTEAVAIALRRHLLKS